MKRHPAKSILIAAALVLLAAIAPATLLAQEPANHPGLVTGAPFLALLGGAALCFGLYALLTGLHPLRLIIGQDNRYSNSKFQVALWFFAFIAVYVATFALRLIHGVHGEIGITQNLLLLTGMSAFTFGAAKGITTSKCNDARDAGIPDPKGTAAEPSLIHDLTHGDALAPPIALAPLPVEIGEGAAVPVAAALVFKRLPRLDLGDTQMVIVTLLAVGTYLINAHYFLAGPEIFAPNTTLPDVDTTILSIFGLGHGAYLAKKAVGNAGES